MIPTKKGLGIEIWGTRDDMDYLYEIISKFWNDEAFFHILKVTRIKIKLSAVSRTSFEKLPTEEG